MYWRIRWQLFSSLSCAIMRERGQVFWYSIERESKIDASSKLFCTCRMCHTLKGQQDKWWRTRQWKITSQHPLQQKKPEESKLIVSSRWVEGLRAFDLRGRSPWVSPWGSRCLRAQLTGTFFIIILFLRIKYSFLFYSSEFFLFYSSFILFTRTRWSMCPELENQARQARNRCKDTEVTPDRPLYINRDTLTGSRRQKIAWLKL